MKRFLWGILLCSLLCQSVFALDISGHKGILMDADSGIILWEKNAEDRSLIASTTKIMTAIVVLENTLMKEIVTVPRQAVGVEGSSMYLQEGEKLTVEDLLYGLMLSSGNDAAVALAVHVSGSVDAFASKMNEKAKVLGLEHTSFANPHGLDSEENYSTASDLARLASYALRNEEFKTIVSSKSYRCGNRRMTNHNKLLWDYSGAVGVKTGYTKQAGRLLVGAAQRDGRQLISVTISAPDDWQDHQKLLDYGFAQYQLREVLEEGMPVAELAVAGGTLESVTLVAAETISFPVLPNEEVSFQIHTPPFVYAPIDRGATMGSVTVYVSGIPAGKTELICGCAVPVPQEEPKGLLEKIFG